MNWLRPPDPAAPGPLLPARVAPGTWIAAALLLAGAALAGFLIGPAGISPGAALAALTDRLPGIEVGSGLSARQDAILFSIRAPRVVLGAMVGGILALCGAAYQGVFRNPLADPYLLGAAAGAGLGATVAIVVTEGRGWITPAAFFGALLAVFLAYRVGRHSEARSPSSLLLAGIAVAAFFTAAQTFVLQRNYGSLQEVYSFILGQLGTGGWSEVQLMLPYAIVSALVIVSHRRVLDVLAVGEEEAASLGVDPLRVRRRLVIAASLGTAAAVAVSGLIGFVGVIVPHTIRLFAGWSNRVVIPLAMTFGAAFMIGADLVGRSVLTPAELPIGVVTAFFGAPFFLLVLRHARGWM
ncbi:MAG TPA: iron ABC transporter permease [Acidimicrobiia bacterium]|nr:iron ABC transporter permease [Acidimicrobiia bacterium]